MMGAHGNNMVGQTANQAQFLPQTQFSGAMNVNVGLGQPGAQAPIPQVSGRGGGGYSQHGGHWHFPTKVQEPAQRNRNWNLYA